MASGIFDSSILIDCLRGHGEAVYSLSPNPPADALEHICSLQRNFSPARGTGMSKT